MPEAPPVTIALAPVMSMTRMLIGRRRTSPSRPVSGRPTAAHPVVSERGRALGNDPRRAGHQDPVVLGPLDEQGPAGDVDAVRRTAFGTVHPRDRKSHGEGKRVSVRVDPGGR